MNNDTATRQVKESTEELKNSVADKTANAVEKLKQEVQARANQIGDVAIGYKGKVSENMSVAADKVHQKSDTAQDFFSDKADLVNEYAHQTIGKVNQIGHKAADVLSVSSEYVKNFDIAETRQQVKETIREKPGASLAIAGVFGLLIGLLMGRKK